MLIGEGMYLYCSLFIYLSICGFVNLLHCHFIRSQTTKGIWMARCVGIEPCTIVMDLEGTDGRERGEVVLII